MFMQRVNVRQFVEMVTRNFTVSERSLAIARRQRERERERERERFFTDVAIAVVLFLYSVHRPLYNGTCDLISKRLIYRTCFCR
jgi:hypothetical protein